MEQNLLFPFIVIAKLNELGIEDGHIPDEAMKASSTLDTNHGPGRGRLNQGPTGSQGTAWCAGESDSDQYLQIDLSEYNTYPNSIDIVAVAGFVRECDREKQYSVVIGHV